MALLARNRYTGKAVAWDASAITSLKLIPVIERARLWNAKLMRLSGQGVGHSRLDSVAHPARVLLARQASVTDRPATRLFCT